MVRSLRGLRSAVLALAALFGVAAAGRAETLYFQNKTDVALIIQGQAIVGGRVVTDRPVVLQPGDKAKVALDGNKIITVREARPPNRILLEKRIPAGPRDTYYYIQADPPLRVKLEEITPFPPPKR